MPEISEEDRLRADLYNYPGPDARQSGGSDAFGTNGSGLSGDDSVSWEKAIMTLAKMARITKPKTVESEFNKLFIGLGRGELLPYASLTT